MLHEDDAAQRIAQSIAGQGIKLTEPNQGKINLVAETSGLLKIKSELLCELNTMDQLAVATLHNNRLVKAGEIVAGTRVIPLVIDEKKILRAEELLASHQSKLVQVLPLRSLAVGMVTTGNEVYFGRIKDAFGPAVKNKLVEYGCTLMEQVFTPDDQEVTARAVTDLMVKGAEMIVVTGGMSVDPDDNTPAAIRATGAEIISYGSPVLPGSMLLLAYYNDIPVLGLPGCVMYSKTTVFDLVLPRILAGERMTKQDVAMLGHGGLCLDCPECVFPHCSFGKGR
jgi:molybdopterin biosynthesis enzyme